MTRPNIDHDKPSRWIPLDDAARLLGLTMRDAMKAFRSGELIGHTRTGHSAPKVDREQVQKLAADRMRGKAVETIVPSVAPDLVPASKAATATGVDAGVIRGLVASGRIRGQNIRGNVHASLSDLTSYFKRRETP
jgi:hypothetical protein